MLLDGGGFSGADLAVHVRSICALMGLLALANATPILVKKVAGPKWAWPLDGGWVLRDGQRLLGASKTVRGVVCAVAATAAGAYAIGWGWETGAVAAGWSMGGDLFASFCKRRLGLAAGSRATGLDQVPEALFPALAVREAVGLSAVDVAVVVGVFMVGEMLLSVWFFRWHLRDRPY